MRATVNGCVHHHVFYSEAGATGGRANMQLEVGLVAEAQVILTTSISTQCIWRKTIRLGAWQRLATLA